MSFDRLELQSPASPLRARFGALSAERRGLFDVVRDTMLAMIGAIRAGVPLGTTVAPTWMDVPPMIYAGTRLSCGPAWCCFPHAMPGAVGSRRAVGLGHRDRHRDGLQNPEQPAARTAPAPMAGPAGPMAGSAQGSAMPLHVSLDELAERRAIAPTWMDWPMVFRDNPAIVEPGMVIFLHMVVTEGARNAAPGETVLVTPDGCERLGRMPLVGDLGTGG